MSQEWEDIDQAACEYQGHEHCQTCGDIATSARVVRIDKANQIALVEHDDIFEEVDVSLLNTLVEGERLLIHGGVAIGTEPPPGEQR